MGIKTAIITILLAIVFAGGGMYAYLYFTQQPDEQSTKAAVDVPLRATQTKPETNEDKTQELQVGDINVPTEKSQLPGPQQFSVYEQYANAPSTQFIDSSVGSGQEATTGATAFVVYTGYLTDGTIFDQSQKNELGQTVAFSFMLGSGQVITGWEQGIFGMKEGGKRRLIIPSQFGYGDAGQGSIPPNAMLIFDVELVKVDKPTAP